MVTSALIQKLRLGAQKTSRRYFDDSPRKTTSQPAAIIDKSREIAYLNLS